jgi:hypothetical protein
MFPGHPVAWSIIAGGILWVFADIVLLPLLNPRMAELVDVPSFIIAHLAYTLLLGITVNRYKKMPVQSARLTELYPYQAGVVGGILGGTAMAMVGIIAGLVIGRGPWYPINLLAAIAVRNFQTMTPEQLSQFSLSGLFCRYRPSSDNLDCYRFHIRRCVVIFTGSSAYLEPHRWWHSVDFRRCGPAAALEPDHGQSGECTFISHRPRSLHHCPGVVGQQV